MRSFVKLAQEICFTV